MARIHIRELSRRPKKAAKVSPRKNQFQPLYRVRREYVVTRKAGSKVSVKDLLSGYPGIRIVDQVNNSSVLVKMPQTLRRRIGQEHPELIVEPNISYDLPQ